MAEGLMRLQPREIMDLTKWVFRAAGIPAGYRVGAQAMVLFAELHESAGLNYLRQRLPYLEKITAAALQIETAGSHQLLIGKGQDLLLHGPALIDLAIGEALAGGKVSVMVPDCDPWPAGLTFMAERAAAAGLTASISYRGSTGSGQIEAGPADDGLWLWRCTKQLQPDGFTLTCALPSAEVGPMSRHEHERGAAPVFQLSGSVKRERERLAHQEGVEVDAVTYEAVKSFANRVLVPVVKETD